MSRTFKDLRINKYQWGIIWLDHNFNKGTIRQRIKKCVCIPNGSFYKKLNRKLDIYAGT